VVRARSKSRAADASQAMADVLQRPILFSSWLSSRYESVSVDALREYVQARLKVFYEEELDVPLVLFDDVSWHARLRISR
jgi:dynein heavy chain 1